MLRRDQKLLASLAGTPANPLVAFEVGLAILEKLLGQVGEERGLPC
jgi:hypothetical protein